MSSFCVSNDGNLLCCDEENSSVCLVGADDSLKGKWKLPFKPQVVCTWKTDQILVAGDGTLASLDKDGKVVKSVDLKKVLPAEKAPAKAASAAAAFSYVSAVTADGNDVFVSVRINTGFAFYRFDANLENPKQIVRGISGCCGQCDIKAKNGKLYHAANCEFQVVTYDRDGKKLSGFGKESRTEVAGFVQCCNPMNIWVGNNGEVFTGEATASRIKRFSADGKMLELLGTSTVAGGCRRVAFDISRMAPKLTCWIRTRITSTF